MMWEGEDGHICEHFHLFKGLNHISSSYYLIIVNSASVQQAKSDRESLQCRSEKGKGRASKFLICKRERAEKGWRNLEKHKWKRESEAGISYNHKWKEKVIPFPIFPFHLWYFFPFDRNLGDQPSIFLTGGGTDVITDHQEDEDWVQMHSN